MLLGLIASIALALAASAGGGAPASPQPEQSIRVLSVSHRVQFPDEVVLKLESEADSDITQVILYYRFARRPVVAYGYPDFTPAPRVTADFRIKTGGASYVPSGVDIAYYYVIRDAAGHEIQSERFHLEYRDPRYQWREVRVGELVVLYHDRSEDAVRRVAADVYAQVASVKDLLGVEAARPVKAVILNDALESRRTFPLVSEAATRGHIFGGFAFGDYDLFVLVGLWRDGMVHEMTHLLMGQALDSPLAKVPAWLNEGLAMYFEPGSHGGDARLEGAARAGRLPPLRSMGSVPGRPADVSLFYAKARSVVGYMMDAYGKDRMAALLRALGAGARVDQAVHDLYRVTLDDLDRDWKAHLLGEAPPKEREARVSASTVAIIVGSVATALAAALLLRLKRGAWRGLTGPR